jgi:outer membrane protein OmpA-like peptidoglycan-associated protein
LQGNELFNADYKVDMNNKDLKVNIKKSKVELLNFQFTDNTPDKNQLKTPAFSIETDAAVTIAQNKLDVIVKNAKLNSRDLEYSNQSSDPITVSIPSFNHETDITVNQFKDDLKVNANKAAIALKNLLFNGLNQKKVEAKIPELTLETAYNIALNPKAKDIHVSRGKFDFHDLLMAEKDENATLIKIPTFGLSDMDIDLKNREVKVTSISSKDAEFQTWLNPDGTLNYQKLIATPEGKKVEATRPNYATAKTVDFKEDVETASTVATAVAEPVKPEKDWLVNINTLELMNYGILFEDRTLKKPVKMTASPINIKLSNISNQPDAKLPFKADIGLNKTGSIKLNGESVISPLSAKIDVDIKNIGLKDFQPYVEKFARLYVLDGKFNVDGKLAVQQPPKKPLDVKFKGNTGIASLLTRDKIQNKDFIKWHNLTFKNLDVDLLANRYSAATLLIEKPYAKVTIRKDKTVNFSDIMISEKNTADKPGKPTKVVKETRSKTTTKTDKPVFKLAKVKIVDGSSDFADLSLILPFAAQIESLDGGAEGISSDQKSTIKVDLKGSAYDLAPVDIAGEISPYLGNFDVSLKFDGLPMPLVTPYMVQFAGYKIEKGKLNLGLKYQVEKGQLNASNNILIDQLELGEKVDNPEAVSLPLELAIALLKDSNGKIKLDVPLTGSLEDPQFSVGGLIFDALVNVLTKIVTAPFNAIASLVGSEENLSVVRFAAGKDSLDDKEMKKLDDVAKALKEKPVLNLEIKGAAFEEQDWPIVREDALMDQLKATKAAELSKEEEKNVRIEQVKLSEDDYNDLLADAFIEKFPNLAEKSLIGTPKLINSESDDFYKVAKQKMSEIIKPDPKRLKDLASDRAQAIAKYIVQKGGIPHERVFILDSAIDPKRDGKDIVSALSLKTD